MNMKRKIALTAFIAVAVLCSLNAVSTDWFRNTLSPAKQVLYDRIARTVLSCGPALDDVTYDAEECLRIFSGYLDDHPGVFWVEPSLGFSGKTENGKPKNRISFSYTHQDSLEKDQQRFIRIVDEFSANLEDAPNDWLKIYHIYSYLSKTITYSTDYMDQGMWSVFFEGIGVCAGFARSFQYLALLEGIPSVVVHGWARNADGTKGERHLWVMADIGGKWYHFDPTWGLQDSEGTVDYTYFCRSRERMEKTHIIDERYPIPVADDDSMSYPSMRNRMLQDYDEASFLRVLTDAVRKGEYSFTVEFGTSAGLNRAVNSLFTEKKIWKMIATAVGSDGITGCTYSADTMSNALKISLKRK